MVTRETRRIIIDEFFVDVEMGTITGITFTSAEESRRAAREMRHLSSYER